MEFDFRNLPAEFFANPYPIYAKLREQNPVYLLPDGGYFLTEHATVNRVYRETANFSSDKKLQFAPVFGTTSPLYEHHTTSLVFNDPPLHTNVRKAIGNALSRRMIQTLQSDLVVLVEQLLDQLGGQDQIEVVEQFAGAIPIEVIGNLLGIPRDRRAPLRDWSLAILGSLEVDLSAEKKREGEQAVADFVTFLDELLASRKVAGAEEGRADSEDIISRLISWEDRGARLTTGELYHQCIFLLNAGHETTTNLIANGLELLLRFPDAQNQLRENPALIDAAVEEMLRMESPNQLGNRTTSKDVVLDGVEIEPGTVLTLGIGAANRDPLVFSDPDTFRLDRRENPHLAFGGGVHTCAGLNIARVEARVALNHFLQRFPTCELVTPPQRNKRARFRGFSELWVSAL